MNDRQFTWEQAIQWLRSQPDQHELVRHCYYDDPIEKAADRFWKSQEWKAVRHLLRHRIPGKVLDLGAGRGISSYAFAREGCDATALEPDPSPLVGAGSIQTLFNVMQLPVTIVSEYGETLPFPENSFDIVYGRAVLHHAANLETFCKESFRVLKDNGCFIATREHVITHKNDLQKFLNDHPLHRYYGGENAFLLPEYVQGISRAGFTLKKVIGPFESVINYAPMSTQEFRSRLIPKTIRRLFIFPKVAEQVWGWVQSRKSQTPGRLYSFMAMKK
jgi:ubiquinone/menaquinone biosynthesis C-methylase UbiE